MQNRRIFLRNSSLAATAVAFSNLKSLAAIFNIAEYNIKMLSSDAGIFTEWGGTILFVLSKAGNIVVDAQFPESANHLIEEIKKKNQNPFSLLINTHHHGDHTSGNIAFKGLVKNVVAQKNSKINQQNAAIERKSEASQLYPDIVFENSWKQKIGNEKIELRYLGPGHTNGDALVYLKKAGIVHVGDLVFNRQHPYIDKTAGASIKNWILILQKAATIYPAKTIFVCGHAGSGYDVVINKNDILAFKNYLEKLLEFTGAQIKAGKTKEEILKTSIIPGAEEWKGEGIERPLTAAYLELTT